LLAEQIGDRTKQRIVVEQRPGGGSIIGTEAAARAAPDGTTLLLVANSFLINASLKSNLPYDPFASFIPVCLLAHTPFVLTVNAKSSHASLNQFMAAAREPQSQLSIGATGPNSTQHVAIEALRQATGANLTFVPYAGGPQVVSNLLGGHISAGLVNYSDVKNHLGTTLRALAVGSRQRLAELPEVPTLAEAGFADIDAVAWMGLMLPAKTPEPVSAQIAAQFQSALAASEIATKLKALEFTPAGQCGAEFGAHLRQQHERSARTIKAANMKME
jgi:tripartite-type tricarboxylate transporter receptor subunit TctC